MGITFEAQKLVKELDLPDSFSVCELGNQMYSIMRGMKITKVPAIGFWKKLGCGRYESIDLNGKATKLVDLNQPIPPQIQYELDRFDIVTNFGTSEHCFNLAQVWKTIHDLTKIGGYIATEQPMQGWQDHGFVNVQPNMIRALCFANDYELLKLNIRRIKGNSSSFIAIMKVTKQDVFKYPIQGRYEAQLKAGQAQTNC